MGFCLFSFYFFFKSDWFGIHHAIPFLMYSSISHGIKLFIPSLHVVLVSLYLYIFYIYIYVYVYISIYLHIYTHRNCATSNFPLSV